MRPLGDPMNRKLVALLLPCLLSTGCRIDEHKDGKGENVSIQTPFGSTSIKTSDSADTAAIGLSAYPGAVAVKNDNGKNDSAANVDMSFGSFHLGVKATSLQTADGQDKVLAFYRKDMAKYGDVIECKNKQPVGQPTRTGQGLTCSDRESVNHDDDSKGVHLHGTLNGHDIDTDSNGKLELRTGSELHQHIVAVEPKDGGTRIGLVMLDLPSQLKDSGRKPE